MTKKESVRRLLFGTAYPHSVAEISQICLLPFPSIRRILGELRREGVNLVESRLYGGRTKRYLIPAGV
jgi:hypothetical protein